MFKILCGLIIGFILHSLVKISAPKFTPSLGYEEKDHGGITFFVQTFLHV